MTEELYEILVRIDWNINQLIAAGCLLLLCEDFVEWGEGRKGGRSRLLVGGTYFLVYMGLYWIPGFGGYLVNMLALFTALFVCLGIDRKNFRLKIFLFGVFMELHWMVESVANMVSYFMIERVDWLIYYLLGEDNPLLGRCYVLSFCGYLLLSWLITGLFLFLAVQLLRTACGRRQWNMEWQEFCVLMIPVINAMAAHNLLRIYNDIYETETGNFMYQSHHAVEYLWIFYYAIILASIVSMVILYQKIRRKQEEENARVLLESQIRDMQSHIGEVERLYAELRSVKHDLRNHLEVMDSLMAQGKMEEAREYAVSFSENTERFYYPVKTGNPVTDVILGEKMSLAQEKKIAFESSFCYPADIGIDAFDISIVLTNALSNAIEAAGEGGSVRISSFRKKSVCLITVENSFAGTLQIGMEGILGTERRKEHGFGLKNIRSAAAKYHGDVQLLQKEDRVILTVLMQARE